MTVERLKNWPSMKLAEIHFLEPTIVPQMLLGVNPEYRDKN